MLAYLFIGGTEKTQHDNLAEVTVQREHSPNDLGQPSTDSAKVQSIFSWKPAMRGSSAFSLPAAHRTGTDGARMAFYFPNIRGSF